MLRCEKGVLLPAIGVVPTFSDEFEMAPLETLSPFDFMSPLKEDDSVFFMGSIGSMKPEPAAEAKMAGKLKRVLSAPSKSLKTDAGKPITPKFSLNLIEALFGLKNLVKKS